MAEIITIPDLENGKVDLDTLADIVNLQEPTTETRLSGPVNTWFGVQSSITSATGLGYTSKASMDASPGTVEGQMARVTEGSGSGLYIWSGSAWVETEDPWEPYVTMARKNGYVVLGGLTQQYFDRSKQAWIISHDRMSVFMGSSSPGAFNIEAASNVEIALNQMYYVDATSVASGTTVTAQKTTSDFNGLSQGAGGFVEDLRLPLFGYRTYGIGGLLVNSPKSLSNSWSPILPIWHKSSNHTISWDKATRTLSWGGQIVCNNLFGGTRTSLVISAGSLTVPSTANYQVIWIDLRAISKDTTGPLNPADVVKCGAYGSYVSDFENAFVGAAYQLPIFVYNAWKSRPAPGFFEDQIAGVTFPADLGVVPSQIADIQLDVSSLNGRVSALEEGSGSGGEGVSETSGEPVYIETGKLYKIGIEGETLISDPAPNVYSTSAQWRGKGIITSIDRPTAGAETPVAVSADGELIYPSSPRLLTGIIGYGQSNSVGANSTPIPGFAASNPYGSVLWKFAGADVRLGYSLLNDVVIDTNSLTGFDPLISEENPAGNGVTVCEGTGRHILFRTDSKLSLKPRTLLFTCGKGGQNIAGLGRGSIPYTNLINGVTRAKQLADEMGLVYWVPAIEWIHGEADVANTNYANDLIALQGDIEDDIQAITGQLAPVIFIMTQPSSHRASYDSTLALLAVTKMSDRFVLAAAGYPIPFGSDYLHYTAEGHFRLGEYVAKAFLNSVTGRRNWQPVSPTTVTRVNDTTIDIEFNVPVVPLVLDPTATAKDSAGGFTCTSNGTKTITNVQVVGDTTIRLTTAEILGATGVVSYAMLGQGATRDAAGIPRGILRDSDPTPSVIDGAPLYNWCVHFRETF